MALFTTPHTCLFTFFSNKTLKPTLSPHSLSFSLSTKPNSIILRSSLSDSNSGEPDVNSKSNITDDWGEKIEPELQNEIQTNLADADPPRDEDEWEEQYAAADNGSISQPPPPQQVSAVVGEEDDGKVEDLKRCLVDTIYGSELGFRASAEVRAEVAELINQLEAVNPTPAPVEAPEILDGNWILLYTAFSELVPLLAVGSTPVLKLKSISQKIDSSNLTIVNSTTLSSPFATFSFSAAATFEVRSPSRIQVKFTEGALQPPEIKTNVELPESVDIFGQRIALSPIQQALNPLQEAVASISRAISGQSPLKIPIPGDRSQSWLLTTYLDKDLRISRGDGGIFVLAKEGSLLLNQ